MKRVNIEISGALFTLRKRYEYALTQCKEGARDVNVHCWIPITYFRSTSISLYFFT